MLFVFFDTKAVVHQEVAPAGQIVKVVLYVEVLKGLKGRVN